jgi:hypothetical protein
MEKGVINYLLAHLIGDFILQNDFMADNKKKSNWVCLLHVLLYIFPFLCLNMLWWQLVLIGIQHYIQDRTQLVTWFMRAKGSWNFAIGPCSPWSIIVTDNIIHLLWIYLVVWMAHGYLILDPVITFMKELIKY